jgi:hypothetical protein
MITNVNGYVCTTPCEAATARSGKDPFAPPGTPQGQSGKTDNSSGLDDPPATILGGALKDLRSANAVAPASNIGPSNQPLLNRLA